MHQPRWLCQGKPQAGTGESPGIIEGTSRNGIRFREAEYQTHAATEDERREKPDVVDDSRRDEHPDHRPLREKRGSLVLVQEARLRRVLAGRLQVERDVDVIVVEVDEHVQAEREERPPNDVDRRQNEGMAMAVAAARLAISSLRSR